jgi:hypothetical protein
MRGRRACDEQFRRADAVHDAGDEGVDRLDRSHNLDVGHGGRRSGQRRDCREQEGGCQTLAQAGEHRCQREVGPHITPDVKTERH